MKPSGAERQMLPKDVKWRLKSGPVYVNVKRMQFLITHFVNGSCRLGIRASTLICVDNLAEMSNVNVTLNSLTRSYYHDQIEKKRKT